MLDVIVQLQRVPPLARIRAHVALVALAALLGQMALHRALIPVHFPAVRTLDRRAGCKKTPSFTRPSIHSQSTKV